MIVAAAVMQHPAEKNGSRAITPASGACARVCLFCSRDAAHTEDGHRFTGVQRPTSGKQSAVPDASGRENATTTTTIVGKRLTPHSRRDQQVTFTRAHTPSKRRRYGGTCDQFRHRDDKNDNENVVLAAGFVARRGRGDDRMKRREKEEQERKKKKQPRYYCCRTSLLAVLALLLVPSVAVAPGMERAQTQRTTKHTSPHHTARRGRSDAAGVPPVQPSPLACACARPRMCVRVPV